MQPISFKNPQLTGCTDTVLRRYRSIRPSSFGGKTMVGSEAALFKVALVGWVLAGFGAGLLLVGFGHVQVPPQYLPFTFDRSAAGNQSDIQPIVFGCDGGLVVNYIKPDKAVAFDFMIDQLRLAMEESRQSTLCEQAARWKVLRTSEAGPDGTAVYVFAVDPGLRNVDYRLSTLVAEAIHRNSDEFYRRLLDLYASRQNVIDVAAVWTDRAADLDRILAR
jgi:hypothetical protein